GGPLRPAPVSKKLRRRLLDGGGDPLDLAGLQQHELRRDGLLDRRRRLRAPLAVADAVHLRVEHDVLAAVQLTPLGRLDRRGDCDVDLLQSARHDVRTEVTLVRIDADAEQLLRPRGIENAEAALTRDLELDDRALADLVQGLLLALRL